MKIPGAFKVKTYTPIVANLWDPSELSPEMWFEPRNGEFTTRYELDIATVDDRGASGVTYQNGGSITRPDIDWSNPSFLRRVVNFSGATTGLISNGAVDLSGGYLLWALVHADTDSSTRYLIRSTSATHGFNRNSGGDWRLLFGSNGADALTMADSGSGVRAILIHYDGAGVASGWLNDWTAAAQTVDRSGSGTLTNPNDTVYIGCVSNTGSSPFNGQIASMGIVPMASPPDQETRDALGLYLKAQFNAAATITTSKTDPATLTGYSGVKQPPEQIVLFGVGQSNRNHNPDANANTDMPLITGGGGARYAEEYPISYHVYEQNGAQAGPKHYTVEGRTTPANRKFGREVVWAHYFANAGPDVEGYIVKATYGATTIDDDWNPNPANDPTPSDPTTEAPGYMYWWSVNRLTTVAANLRPNAKLILCWTHGESDAAFGEANYETLQDTLFDAWVALASTLGLQAPDIYDTLLHPDWEPPADVVPSRPYWQDIQDDKAACAAGRSDVTLLSQDVLDGIDVYNGLQGGEADWIHLNAEGQCVMGEAELAAAGYSL